MTRKPSEKDEPRFYQGPLSQFPFLDGYTPLLRMFEVSHDTSRESIHTEVQQAFDQLKAKIPWLGGHVARVNGVVQVLPWPDDAPPNNVLRKDADDVLAPFNKIMAAGGPLAMFPGDHIAPCPALPAPHGITHLPVPVVILSVIFIEGGLLVVIAAHHQIMDGAAMMALWNLLAAVMNGEPDPIPKETLEQANRERSRLIPLLGPHDPVKDYSHLLRPDDFEFRPPPPMSWCVFRVPLAALQEIKRLVGDRSSPGWDPEISYISHDDALSALAWQRISTVRLANGRRPEQVSKFGRAVDLRSAIGLPDSFMGQFVGHSPTRLPLGEVATAPLARLACMLRRDLMEATTEWAARSYATFVAKSDKNKLLYGGVYNPHVDIGASSLFPMKEAYKPAHLGILGRSKMFRKPDVAPIPGCMYFFPSDNEKDMQLVLCMQREDLAGLVNDRVWSKYIECIDVGRARDTKRSEYKL